MARHSPRSFEFYNDNERREVLTALTHCKQCLVREESNLDKSNQFTTHVRADVLDRLIQDFHEFTLTN